MMTCPTCGASFEPELSTALPFCCDRCRQIDLGRWFNEEHGMPLDEGESEEADRETNGESR